MSIIIPESYVEIDHHILTETCPVCNETFKVGDSIEIVPIQKSKDGSDFTSVAVVVHTKCHYV